jgi:hypothetical protein
MLVEISGERFENFTYPNVRSVDRVEFISKLLVNIGPALVAGPPYERRMACRQAAALQF